MTTTYDPHHPQYLDEADTRLELARAFAVCTDCRRCVQMCPSFPTLFSYAERCADRDLGLMSPAQQDHVVDLCFNCKMCVVECPFAPGADPAAIDLPRLMLRAKAMRFETGQLRWRTRAMTTLLGHTDAMSEVASRVVQVVNRVIGAAPRSVVRRMLQLVTGIVHVRQIPTFTRSRFSMWFKQRPKVRVGRKQGSVAVYPTCIVEYHEPAIGKALVKVYEHNGIECSLSTARCCGATSLHNGDLAQFTKIAVDNVAILAGEIRDGNEIVVAQPMCSFVLKNDYLTYVGGPDAALVSQHVFDAAEYLMKVHNTEGSSLDIEFRGEVPDTVAYCAPTHLLAQNIGLPSRDLLKLAGARVTLVQQPSGVDGIWGWRGEYARTSLGLADKLGAAVRDAGCEAVASDCQVSNIVLKEATEVRAVHPLQVIAVAYDIEASERTDE